MRSIKNEETVKMNYAVDCCTKSKCFLPMILFYNYMPSFIAFILTAQSQLLNTILFSEK